MPAMRTMVAFLAPSDILSAQSIGRSYQQQLYPHPTEAGIANGPTGWGKIYQQHNDFTMAVLRANTAGRYQVDERCIGCAVCAEIAPRNFRFDHEQGYAYVFRQPNGDTEERLCEEAMEICPVDAIDDTSGGDDGGLPCPQR